MAHKLWSENKRKGTTVGGDDKCDCRMGADPPFRPGSCFSRSVASLARTARLACLLGRSLLLTRSLLSSAAIPRVVCAVASMGRQRAARQHTEATARSDDAVLEPHREAKQASAGRPRKRPRAAEAAAAAAEGGDEAAEAQPAAKAKPTKATKPAKAAKPAPEKPAAYLVKSEPHEFSLDDLEARPEQTEGWEGVRNAQARNFLRGMAVGDQAFFYHSSCKVPGIVAIVQVVRAAYPDATAFDPASKYADPKSSPDDPKWYQVDFKLVRRLARQITLEVLKRHKDGGLAGMALFNRPRLSVQPVTKEQWDFVLSLENAEEASQE